MRRGKGENVTGISEKIFVLFEETTPSVDFGDNVFTEGAYVHSTESPASLTEGDGAAEP